MGTWIDGHSPKYSARRRTWTRLGAGTHFRRTHSLSKRGHFRWSPRTTPPFGTSTWHQPLRAGKAARRIKRQHPDEGDAAFDWWTSPPPTPPPPPKSYSGFEAGAPEPSMLGSLTCAGLPGPNFFFFLGWDLGYVTGLLVGPGVFWNSPAKAPTGRKRGGRAVSRNRSPRVVVDRGSV